MEPTQTPEEVIKATEDKYGAAMVAGIIAQTLDFMVPDEYARHRAKLRELREMLQRSEQNAKSLATRPLKAPTKESVAAYNKQRNPERKMKATERAASSEQHWKSYRHSTARRARAKLEVAVLRKALAEHEKMMKEKYSDDGIVKATFNRVPAPQPDDLERAESTQLGYPLLY